MNRAGSGERGVTIVELLTAMVIAGIVLTLGMTAYRGVLKSFLYKSRAAAGVSAAVIAKKRIERACGRFVKIDRCTEREMSGLDGSDHPATLRFTGSVLMDGKDTVAALEEFGFSLREERKAAGNLVAVLLWEGTLPKGGWIGGAVAVRRGL